MKTLLTLITALFISASTFAQAPVNFKKGMIKVSVIYPSGEGKTFDMEYYTTKHLPMVSGLLGDAVKGATVEKGIGGAAPESIAPYVAMGNLYFDTLEDFQNAFGPNAEEIMKDVPNFTNSEPIIQISEVTL